MKIPVVAVLGNHDFESGKQHEIRRILIDAGVSVVSMRATESKARLRGGERLCRRIRSRGARPWGEHAIKVFRPGGVDEALKLESALARLRTHPRGACCITRRSAEPSTASRSNLSHKSGRAASKNQSTGTV